MAAAAALLSAMTLLAQPKNAAENDWLLPNLGMRLSVQVSNPTQHSTTTLATVPIVKAQLVAPDFPGRLAFALLISKSGDSTPATFLPLQIDDLDGDGTPDQLLFPVNLAAGEQRQVDVYYSTKLTDTISYPKQVNAKHSYGYNRQVASLESELIGYRTYGGFFLDFMGRPAGRTGLNNDLAGYVSIHRDLGTGRDVFHIGRTLGLGGIFLRRGDKIYQPPMNVPDYAHKPSPEVVPHYRVISQGPLRAIVETTLDNWDLDGDIVRLRAIYSIDGGTSFVRCHFDATPVKIQAGHEYEVGVGVRHLPNGDVSAAGDQLIVTGKQNARDGDIGLGLYYDNAAFSKPEQIRTAEDGNHAVILNSKLMAGQSTMGSYAIAGAWSGSDTANPASALKEITKAVSAKVETGNYRFQRTPRPDKEDAEAQ